jgi:LysR family transcriptional regulator, nitrogen assimilation regulatory protein
MDGFSSLPGSRCGRSDGLVRQSEPSTYDASMHLKQSLPGIVSFMSVYETGSFTLAANRLNATQPGISQRVRALEAQLGVKLFNRGPTAISPTPAGETYYRQCIEILRAIDAAVKMLQPFGAGEGGQLSIGVSPAFTQGVLATTLATFMDEFPNVQVSVEDTHGGSAVERVQDGRVDFAIVPAAAFPLSVRSSALARIPEVLVSSHLSDRTQLEHVVLAEQPPLKLVLPPQNVSNRAVFERYFIENEVKVERILAPDAPGVALSLVAESDWSSIQAAALFKSGALARSPLVINPIVGPPIIFDWVVIESFQTVTSEPAAQFLDRLRADVRREVSAWNAIFGLSESLTGPEVTNALRA